MFYVGQKVVCIANWRPYSNAYNNAPKKGSIYTVRELLNLGTAPSIRLVEIVNDPVDVYVNIGFAIEASWITTAFRPLTERKTDISVFRALLNPKQVEPA